MTLATRLRAVLLATVLAPTLALAAQEPKAGNQYYEDAVEHGFKIKVPKGWDQIPPQPGEKHLLASYSSPFNDYILVGNGQPLFVEVHLVVFDERDSEREDDDPGKRLTPEALETEEVLDWVKDHIRGKHWRRTEDDPEKLRVKGVVGARQYEYEASHVDDDEVPVRAFVAEYVLEPGLAVCLIGNGPGDSRDWRGYNKAYEKMARSFKRVEVERSLLDASAAMASPRAKKRAELQLEVAKLSGWNLYETENYFIVSDVDDDDFIEELMVRIEAIRDVYEQQYPPEQARAIREKQEEEKERRRKRKQAEEGDEEEEEDDEDEERSISAIDPIEASRTSVLRVCKSRDMYHEYGGPGGSAGYWSSRRKELVIYDDKAGGGRTDTWIVLNHEAFHQYIYYFYGELAPHSWYNEGTGDFYSGYTYKHKKFNLKENSWRVRTIQQSIREDEYAPLKDFVTWTQSQYYGNNDLKLHGGICYAQGWSFIYFLRTGPKEKPRGWDPAWGDILDTYLLTLGTTGDLDEAVERAFAGVDWTRLEEAWKNYTLSL